MPTVESVAENAANIERVCNRLRRELLSRLREEAFFTYNVSVTVQNGTVRTGKYAAEVCEHFRAGS